MENTIPEYEMAAPRLELRWVDVEPNEDEDTPYKWTVECIYALVLRLSEYDIRRERYDTEGNPLPNVDVKVVEIGRTRSTGTAASRLGHSGVYTPFRDHAHAKWDTAQLGNLPVYAVCCGRATLVEFKHEVE